MLKNYQYCYWRDGVDGEKKKQIVTKNNKKSKNRRGSKEVTIKRGEMVIFHEEMSCKMKGIKEKRNKL